MSDRNFNEWIAGFRNCISSYGYYVDFEKVYNKVSEIKIELNILNSLIGSKNIEDDFEKLIVKYPEILKCIPVLLAVRSNEIYVIDCDGEYIYDFRDMNYPIEQYKVFMRETGLFDLLKDHIINNLIDYVTGVETGLDTHGRKSRTGDAMENIVENYIIKSGYEKNKTYFKEMYIHQITDKWGIDLSEISNKGKSEKRFDFVIKTDNKIYAIETNFYSGGGSKLNETARSYKQIFEESQHINGFEFIWITDGQGWMSARNNLEETFDAMKNIYCIKELENGILDKCII